MKTYKRKRWPLKAQIALRELYKGEKTLQGKYDILFKASGADSMTFSHNPTLRTRVAILEHDWLGDRGYILLTLC